MLSDANLSLLGRTVKLYGICATIGKWSQQVLLFSSNPLLLVIPFSPLNALHELSYHTLHARFTDATFLLMVIMGDI
jgi:hypothetical protein